MSDQPDTPADDRKPQPGREPKSLDDLAACSGHAE